MLPESLPEALLDATAVAIMPLLFGAAATSAWDVFADWAASGYTAAPALVLGLAALLVLPVLALIGRLAQRPSEADHRTQLVRRSRNVTTGGRAAESSGPDTVSWPARAWIEIDGTQHAIAREMVRLGREDDNDIVLPDKTVHRYHAVIHRTGDAEFRITDLSSSNGNGILLNGQRVGDARLHHGDKVQLGQAKLEFRERPA